MVFVEEECVSAEELKVSTDDVTRIQFGDEVTILTALNFPNTIADQAG